MKIDNNINEFINSISKTIPELDMILKEHIEYYEEILPYVLMDEFSSDVIERIDQELSFEKFTQIIEEELLKNNSETSTLIKTTFSETIDSYAAEDKSLHTKILSCLGSKEKIKETLIYR